MVSRLTLFAQYGVTLLYTKKYQKTVLPLLLVMASTLIAAILYGAQQFNALSQNNAQLLTNQAIRQC